MLRQAPHHLVSKFEPICLKGVVGMAGLQDVYGLGGPTGCRVAQAEKPNLF